jgi:hypothetical protein
MSFDLFGDRPPCPDPEKYIWVKTKEGAYWRRKRGTVTNAKLNTVFANNVRNSKVASPAAKRIVLKLRPFLHDLNTGRLTAKLAGALIKSINQNGQPDFSFLRKFEFQQPPLGKLLTAQMDISRHNDEIRITIPIYEYTMEPKNAIVTDYYFEAILLYGDVTEDNGLRIDSVISPLYPYKNIMESNCVLALQLPKTSFPWMVILKASSLEGNEPAVHPRNYGMRVVMVG